MDGERGAGNPVLSTVCGRVPQLHKHIPLACQPLVFFIFLEWLVAFIALSIVNLSNPLIFSASNTDNILLHNIFVMCNIKHSFDKIKQLQ